MIKNIFQTRKSSSTFSVRLNLDYQSKQLQLQRLDDYLKPEITWSEFSVFQKLTLRRVWDLSGNTLAFSFNLAGSNLEANYPPLKSWVAQWRHRDEATRLYVHCHTWQILPVRKTLTITLCRMLILTVKDRIQVRIIPRGKCRVKNRCNG